MQNFIFTILCTSQACFSTYYYDPTLVDNLYTCVIYGNFCCITWEGDKIMVLAASLFWQSLPAYWL